MNRFSWLSVGALSLLSLAACGDDTASGGSASGGGSEGGGETGGSGPTAGSSEGGSGEGGGANAQWTTLVTGDWSLDAGGEITSDLHSVVLDHDVFVGAIRPISPQGTHHTVLAIGDFSAGNILYASGVDTNALEFPPGVGLRLRAGDNIVLQLHVFNPSQEPLSGTSGIEIVEIAPEDVVNEADIYLPGPLNLNIPPNQTSTKTGTCVIDNEQTVFAVFPHMHQLGAHFKTTLNVGGVDTVIHDDDYDFYHQAFIPFEPTTLSPGDSIKTECTWNNTTSQ
ncbi:MAG: hypothetical protein JNK04_06575, partial [Myxococcales bacterium]|nr:hypothetical protein [Myxococcales bacterium]